MARTRRQKNEDDSPGEVPEPAAERGKYSVVIDADLVRKVRMLAAAENVSGPDWVNNHLRRIVRETWRSTMDDVDRD